MKLRMFLMLSVFSLGMHAVAISADGFTDRLELEAKLDAYMKPIMDAKDFSGTILMAKEGKILVAKGYGMANYELGISNSPETVFHVASVTKPFTVTLILMLEEQGKLATSDFVAKYLPDYPHGDKITIHHLLTHTSGIPNYSNFDDYAEYMLKPHTLKETVDWFKDKPLLFEPGSQGFNYSNSNYTLLAYLIEQVTGEDYRSFARGKIFEPLGMTKTDSYSNEEIVPDKADNYAVGPDGFIHAAWYDKSFKLGSGSLYTTVLDLYKFHQALYTEKILSRKSIEKMFREQYGWFGGRFGEGNYYINGSSPGVSALFYRSINSDACLIFLSNVRAGSYFDMFQDLPKLLKGEDYKIPVIKSYPVTEFTREMAAPYLGEFERDNSFSFSIVNKRGHMFIKIGYLYSYLAPDGKDRFVQKNRRWVLQFGRDEEAAVTHALYGPEGRMNRFEKVR